MMEGTRIVKLAPNQDVTSVTFEQAFGEYSEARGRGAQRRAERKAARQEKKMQRIHNRQDRKVARQEVKAAKQAAKQERKTAKKVMKQDRRSQASQMRQDRRLNRKTMRMQRRNIGREEVLPDEESVTETEMLDENLPENQPVNQEEQSSGGEQEQSQQEQGGGYSEEQGGGEQEQDSEEEQGGYSEEEGSEEGFEESEEGEDMEGFDAGDNIEVTDNSNIKVHPRIQEATNKIEWNHGMVQRLKRGREHALRNGKNTSAFDATIRQHQDRIDELEENLSGFCEAAGGRGKRHQQNVKAQIKRGREVSRAARMKAVGNAKARRFNKANNAVNKNNGGSETPVDKELNPQIEENRIEVPATENSSFDAKDYMNESSSNAAGDYKAKRSINPVHVLIGVGVAALAIYGIRKAKLI